jgi:hypothetical protein
MSEFLSLIVENIKLENLVIITFNRIDSVYYVMTHNTTQRT